MKKRERKRAKTSISTEPAPAPRRVPLLAETAPATKPPEDTSWKLDPDLRAFACLLSYETGWAVEPETIVWRFEAAAKIIEVDRPKDSQSLYTAARGPLTMSADTAIAEVRRRWGELRGQQVEVFAFPDRAKPQPVELLGARAQYLRQLARRTWTDAYDCLGKPSTGLSPGWSAIEVIATSYVDIIRTIADRIRTANTGDQSASATHTRNVAVARVLDLINPQGGI